jgi:hypothetical protein
MKERAVAAAGSRLWRAGRCLPRAPPVGAAWSPRYTWAGSVHQLPPRTELGWGGHLRRPAPRARQGSGTAARLRRPVIQADMEEIFGEAHLRDRRSVEFTG